MVKEIHLSVMMILITLMACHKDSNRIDAAQEHELMGAIAEGNWVEVERICTDLKAMQPESPLAKRLLYWAFLNQSKMKQASMLSADLSLIDEKGKNEVIDFALRVVEIHGESAIAWAFLSRAQQNADMKDEALKNADRALSLDEDCALAWHIKGLALGGMARNREAVKCFDKAIEIEPGDCTTWTNKGRALWQMDLHADAIECFSKAIEINSSYTYSWSSKGAVLAQMSRYAEALERSQTQLQSRAWCSRARPDQPIAGRGALPFGPRLSPMS